MSLLADLIQLVLPERCAGCGLTPGLLCRACATPLTLPARPVRLAPAPGGLPPTWTVATYAGAVRALVVAHKEHGRTDLARPLGATLTRAVLAAAARAAPSQRGVTGPGETLAGPAPPGAEPPPWSGVPASGAAACRPEAPPRRGIPPPARAPTGATPPAAPEDRLVLVPVPSARRAVRQRGHDPVLRMTVVVVRMLRAAGLPVTGVDALRQRRGVSDQAGLTAAERAANLAGALEVRSRVEVAGRRVMVVDDVITTGATLAESARALGLAGAEVVAAATVAATPLRREG